METKKPIVILQNCFKNDTSPVGPIITYIPQLTWQLLGNSPTVSPCQ